MNSVARFSFVVVFMTSLVCLAVSNHIFPAECSNSDYPTGIGSRIVFFFNEIRLETETQNILEQTSQSYVPASGHGEDSFGWSVGDVPVNAKPILYWHMIHIDGLRDWKQTGVITLQNQYQGLQGKWEYETVAEYRCRT